MPEINPASPLPPDVLPDERLSRFITDRSQFKPEKGIVAVGAFLPPPNGRKSVYRTKDCSESEIWEIGQKYVTEMREDRKPIKARGDILALDVFTNDLKLDANGTPHFRHADIIGWGSNSALTRMQALNLANKATLKLNR